MTENDRAKIGESMRAFSLERFFSNAVSVRQELGLPIPGKIAGDCAALSNELAAVLAQFPGKSRLHRVISLQHPQVKEGFPGAHVLLLKEIAEATFVLDPTILHHVPFILGRDERVKSHLPSMVGGPSNVSFSNQGELVTIEHFGVQKGMGANALYKFHFAPEYAVGATGLENADVDQSGYVIRGVLPSGIFQMLFDNTLSGKVWWIEEGRSCQIDLDSKIEERAGLERKLAHLELDLEMAIKFLRDTPGLKRVLRSQRGYD